MIRYGLKSMAWAKSISKWQLHIATCLQHLHNDHSKRFAPSTSSSHRFCSLSWLQYGPSRSQMYHWSFKNPKLHEITWIKFSHGYHIRADALSVFLRMKPVTKACLGRHAAVNLGEFPSESRGSELRFLGRQADWQDQRWPCQIFWWRHFSLATRDFSSSSS